MSPFLFVSVPFPTEKPLICRWRSVPFRSVSFRFSLHARQSTYKCEFYFASCANATEDVSSCRDKVAPSRCPQPQEAPCVASRVGRKRLGLTAHARAFAVECNRKSVSENRAVYTKSAGYKYALVDWVG